MITTEDIEKLATLSRLKISDKEKEQFQKEIGSILAYVDQVNKVSGTLKDEPIINENHNAMREDVVTRKKGEYTEALVSSAPAREGNFIRVKKIL